MFFNNSVIRYNFILQSIPCTPWNCQIKWTRPLDYFSRQYGILHDMLLKVIKSDYILMIILLPMKKICIKYSITTEV